MDNDAPPGWDARLSQVTPQHFLPGGPQNFAYKHTLDKTSFLITPQLTEWASCSQIRFATSKR